MDQGQNIDHAHSLARLQGYRQHYQESLAKGGGENVVTHGEMAAVLDEVITLFKSSGVGVRKNAVGTPIPPKRSWELHG